MMTPFSYLIAITTSRNNAEVILAILNIAEKGQAFHGFSNGAVSTDLWIIPKGKNNKQEIITRLQALPAIRIVSVVYLSLFCADMPLTLARRQPARMTGRTGLISFWYIGVLISEGCIHSQTRLSQILKGKRKITADTALRLSKYFGNSPKFWLGLQDDYDLEAERSVKKSVLNSIKAFPSNAG